MLYGFEKPTADRLVKVAGVPPTVNSHDSKSRRRPQILGLTAVFLTPGGGIPARSGSTLGSATCTRYTVAGGTRASTSETETVYNDFTSAIAGNVEIYATIMDDIWVAIAEDC